MSSSSHLRQALHPTQVLRRQPSGLVGDARDVQQAVVTEELGPALRGRVRLVEGADQRVPLVAVRIRRNTVQRCEKLGGVALGLLR